MVTITLYVRQQKRHRCIEFYTIHYTQIYTQGYTQMYSLLDSVGEGEGGMIWENGIEMCIRSYMKHITVQVQCMILDASGWGTGTTQRDGTGREVGGRFRMGTTWIPVADSC